MPATCSARLPVYALLIAAFVPATTYFGFNLQGLVMFGLYALAGKATAFVGPLLLGLVVQWTSSQRLGMTVIVVLLLCGLIAITLVREPSPTAHLPWAPAGGAAGPGLLDVEAQRREDVEILALYGVEARLEATAAADAAGAGEEPVRPRLDRVLTVGAVHDLQVPGVV